ncbi:hypothetical protein Hanom_Chr03g00213361 [Helianthus anomalus]
MTTLKRSMLLGIPSIIAASIVACVFSTSAYFCRHITAAFSTNILSETTRFLLKTRACFTEVFFQKASETLEFHDECRIHFLKYTPPSISYT